MDIVQRLTKLKDEVDRLNNLIATLKGKKELLEEQLKTDFDFYNFDDAQIFYEKRIVELSDIQVEIDKELSKIETELF